MRILLSVLVFLIVSGINAQQSVHTYKYVIVSKRFDFQKSENQYQLNEMAKFLFEKYNFNAVFEGSYPEDLYYNDCLGLKSVIVDESNMFVTKLRVELRDCKNELVFTSKAGKSKQKEYRATYQEALRRAFESFKSLNYKYIPSEKTTLNKIKTPDTPVVSAVPQIEDPVSVPEEETVLVELPENIEEKLTKDISASQYPTLYAQSTSLGFQLVDTSPKILFKIYKTGKSDVYLLTDKKGLFYKEGDHWVAEFFENTKVVRKVYSVKF